MPEETVHESRKSRSRQALATYFRRIARALGRGEPVPVDDAGTVTVDPAAEQEVEVELEREDGTVHFEVEMEWPEAEGEIDDEAAASNGDTEVAHPNAENTNVSKLVLMWGEGDRRQTLAGNGSLDLNGNIVAPNSLFPRESLPDHMQELTRWLRSTGGDKWRLNWHNEHLQNLWVRRALVAAVDWSTAGANGWGDERSVPIESHTYLLDAQSQSTFSSDFLDSLHSWPVESDPEAAEEYLRRGGYSKQGGQWVDPSGNTASIDLIYPSAIADYAGADVIATASSEEKLDYAREIGADETVDYTAVDSFADAVREVTDGRGVDVVVDHIGADTWSDSLASLAKGGRLVTCGATTGANPETEIRRIFWDQLSVIGSTMATPGEIDDVLPLVWDGTFESHVRATLPMSETARAHEMLENREGFGSVVVRPDSEL
jgi:amphi-Trp domain-containing protein